MTDSLTFAKDLLHHAKVGLAQGIAFDPAGEGYLRLCYAQPASVLEVALERLVAPLPSQRTVSFARMEQMVGDLVIQGTLGGNLCV